MLLLVTEEKTGLAWSAEEDRRLVERHQAFHAELSAQKKFVAAGRLQPENTATRLQKRAGKVTTVDGPFAETKEVLGGFYLIDVDSHEEALAWAARCPSAEYGPVEVRPLT
ncbi:MAG: YciI family protein [Myxococcaceae bacterium]|nr:YciI family protein [Myxococcaceae bacterium]MCI0669646.1 YciI family protein [Myxococcaceae bacterium]